MLRHFDGGGQFLQGCVLGHIIRSCGQRVFAKAAKISALAVSSPVTTRP